MPITWRNISGPNFGSANQLASSATDTITQGLESIRDVARDVSRQGSEEFQTQADINTSNLIANIDQLNQEELDAYDIASLQSQYGTQYDAGSVASALSNRADSLREIARQKDVADREQQRIDISKATSESNIAVNNARLAADRAQRERDQIFRDTSGDLLSELGNYSSKADLTRAITNLSKASNLSATEAESLSNTANRLWDSNIGVSEAQSRVLNAANDTASAHNTQRTNEALLKLDHEAKNRGFDPVLAGLQYDQNEALSDVYAEIAGQVKSNGVPWESDNVTGFQSAFAKKMGRNPTGAEARYLLSTGLTESWYSDAGLKMSEVNKSLDRYKELLGDSDKVQWYNNSRTKIEQAAARYAAENARSLATYTKQAVNNNQKRFKGESGFLPISGTVIDFRDNAPKDLTDTTWITGGTNN